MVYGQHLLHSRGNYELRTINYEALITDFKN
jgi:hypothetical protein